MTQGVGSVVNVPVDGLVPYVMRPAQLHTMVMDVRRSVTVRMVDFVTIKLEFVNVKLVTQDNIVEQNVRRESLV